MKRKHVREGDRVRREGLVHVVDQIWFTKPLTYHYTARCGAHWSRSHPMRRASARINCLGCFVEPAIPF